MSSAAIHKLSNPEAQRCCCLPHQRTSLCMSHGHSCLPFLHTGRPAVLVSSERHCTAECWPSPHPPGRQLADHRSCPAGRRQRVVVQRRLAAGLDVRAKCSSWASDCPARWVDRPGGWLQRRMVARAAVPGLRGHAAGPAQGVTAAVKAGLRRLVSLLHPPATAHTPHQQCTSSVQDQTRRFVSQCWCTTPHSWLPLPDHSPYPEPLTGLNL